MPNIRVVADTKIVNGRSYTCASNATIDVPDSDAQILTANGWINAAGTSGAVATFVGKTAERPDKPAKSQAFLDTTLGLTVVWDGSNWRNPATGAAV
jgi:hypothetical protein